MFHVANLMQSGILKYSPVPHHFPADQQDTNEHSQPTTPRGYVYDHWQNFEFVHSSMPKKLLNYKELLPFLKREQVTTYFICFMNVLFPDSPAPSK